MRWELDSCPYRAQRLFNWELHPIVLLHEAFLWGALASRTCYSHDPKQSAENKVWSETSTGGTNGDGH